MAPAKVASEYYSSEEMVRMLFEGVYNSLNSQHSGQLHNVCKYAY